MDSNTLIKLAARCEIATGPDRELDGEIFCELGLAPLVEGAFDAYRAPTYMVSLDAAETLVPHEHEWLRKSPGFMTVYREPVSSKDWATHFEGASISAPRALVAACLRSRAAALCPTN